MARLVNILGILVLASLCVLVSSSEKGTHCVKVAAQCATQGPLCCNKTIDEIFTSDHFDQMFKHRNEPQTHAIGFYDYESFITAARTFEPLGFGTLGGEDVQKRELAAFFAHVAHETTCGYSAAKDGPYAWGLCYKEELSPPKIYCEDSFLYPCSKGVSYHGRGALPLYWNSNYGAVGRGLKIDILNHPEQISDNATTAFQAAIWKWMNSVKVAQPSPHEIMVNKWVPSKNDTRSFRFPGFGMTINILNGDLECGHGSDPRMEDRVAHFHYFLNIIDPAVDAGPNLDCGLQAVLNAPTATQ